MTPDQWYAKAKAFRAVNSVRQKETTTVRESLSSKGYPWMICAKPLYLKNQTIGAPPVPCGTCTNCRVNHRRKRTARYLLETLAHADSTFVTLTIEDDHLTYAHGSDGAPVLTLVPDDVQLLLKRMRKRQRFRYVAVGEYGDKRGRPHYHLLLFGVNALESYTLCTEKWGKGFVTVGEVNKQRASYMAGYTTKKMTKWDDERLNGGQHPEFMRQSLRPTIGYMALPHLEKLHYTYGGAKMLADTEDVAKTIRIGGKIWPLDRTIRNALRRKLGVIAEDTARQALVPEITEEQYHQATLENERVHRRRVTRSQF